MDYKYSFVKSPDPLLHGRKNSPPLYTDLLSSNKELVGKHQQPMGPADAEINNYQQTTLRDRSVQENLGPMFQPFGVDITHMPITNPPIFQSSLPAFDQPVHKRRISISNGQISQLGVDLETVENLYNCQYPFLPSKAQQASNPQQVESLNANAYPSFDPNELQNLPQHTTSIPERAPQRSSQNLYPPPSPFDSNIKLNPSAVDVATASSHVPINQAYANMQLRLQAQMQHQALKSAQFIVNPSTPASKSPISSSSSSCQNIHDHSNENRIIYSSTSHNANSSTANITSQGAGMKNATGLPYGLNHPDISLTNVFLESQHNETAPVLSENINNNVVVHNQSVSSPAVAPVCAAAMPSPQKSSVNVGGKENSAKAWKRARLLERNRIAASKCRQRKKISQLQLQREFDQISMENKVMKVKIQHYEKLIQKMKKISHLHLQQHTVHSRGSSYPKLESKDHATNVFLKMVEEMISNSSLDDE
ncbi:hypothetical protein SKDZ_05G1190 [Saccharomyces kudriavzevii ZP591]|nr:hypothetical protein SKDZ_05G1190 [Saccharomyces kudriavzevii ZP591]